MPESRLGCYTRWGPCGPLFLENRKHQMEAEWEYELFLMSLEDFFFLNSCAGSKLCSVYGATTPISIININLQNWKKSLKSDVLKPISIPFYFLLQAPPVNHVKCHRLIDRLCFVFLLCHEKTSCLHPCHFNLKIFMSFNHLGKRERAGRARAAGGSSHLPLL